MKNICFSPYDYETSSPDPENCYPIQVAILILDGHTLEKVDGGFFSSYMKPAHLETIEDVYKDSNIEDQALNIAGVSREDILTFPNEKIVWNNFIDFCLRYAGGKSEWDRCINIGWNNNGFDDLITKRYCKKYKTKYPFNKRFSIDMMVEWYTWVEGLGGDWEVESFSMDYARNYLGLPDDDMYGKKHTATRDIHDLSKIFIRFQSWKRRLAKRYDFRGSMKNG